MTNSTRSNLIDAMRDALQRRGLHGVGLNEILASANAPKGSLYYHFPGGKGELAVAAIERASEGIERFFDKVFARHDDPLAALQEWLAAAARQLEDTGFERGCPLATVALETTVDDASIRAALASSFTRIRSVLTDRLQASGFEAQRAGRLAALIVSTYEGGLVQSRVAGTSQPLREASEALIDMLRMYRGERL